MLMRGHGDSDQIGIFLSRVSTRKATHGQTVRRSLSNPEVSGSKLLSRTETTKIAHEQNIRKCSAAALNKAERLI